jgi:hypothetical protein
MWFIDPSGYYREINGKLVNVGTNKQVPTINHIRNRGYMNKEELLKEIALELVIKIRGIELDIELINDIDLRFLANKFTTDNDFRVYLTNYYSTILTIEHLYQALDKAEISVVEEYVDYVLENIQYVKELINKEEERKVKILSDLLSKIRNS